MSEKWLYGASVQGIQGYIFQTNKLKDVIGASELVKELCETDFKREFALTGSVEYIVKAAGNIKLILDSEEDCKRIVFQFPKYAMEKAPGITLSQAVVKCVSDDMTEDRKKLEDRLRAQRNRPCKSLTLGSVAMHRSPLTGLPAVPHKDNEPLDEGVLRKREILEEKSVNKTLYQIFIGKEDVKYRDMGLDIKDLTGENDWIAIIHADGNSLGEVVKALGSEDGEKLCEFSKNLDEATKLAAQEAYKKIKKEYKGKIDFKKHPIRPIVLGGDDLTVICRGDIAIDFVKEYIDQFEQETQKLPSKKLTACAGIAFIKSSYPFSFGYELAETLCDMAKKDAKSDVIKNANGGKVPSCLMFHKVQSSFVEDYESIKQKELTLKDGSSLCYGPYYLTEQTDRWTIKELCDKANEFANEENNSVKTSVREWLTKMHEDTEVAKQYSERVKAISGNSKLYECATTESARKSYPAYDILSLVTIKNQKTR